MICKLKTILIFLFVLNVSFAQDTFDKIAKEACECIDKKEVNISDTSDIQTLQLSLGTCVMESYLLHKDEFPESEKVAMDDQDGLRKLGEKVAIKMVNYCPNYILELGRKYLDENGDNSTTKENYSYIMGTVTDIEIKQFVTIKLKDQNKRTHSFLFLDYFDTASVYTEGNLKVGDSLNIGYSEYELYDPTKKDFSYFKIIMSLEKK
jgi:hypothetical protein